MDILGAIGGLAQGIGAIGGAAGGIASLFGSKKQKVPAEAQEAMRLQSELLTGLTGGSSPAFSRMMDLERNDARTKLLMAINEMVRQNRRAMTRGRAGVIMNPDRRDESIARALMGVYENENDRARAKAKADALAVLGQAPNVANTFMRADAYNAAGDASRNAGRVAGFKTIGMLGDEVPRIQEIFSSLGAGAPSASINSPRKTERKLFSGGLY